MFLLLGKVRKDFKNIINSIPEEQKKEFLSKVEEILLQALKVYVESQINKK